MRVGRARGQAFDIAAVEARTSFPRVLDNLDLARLRDRIVEVVAGSAQN